MFIHWSKNTVASTGCFQLKKACLWVQYAETQVSHLVYRCTIIRTPWQCMLYIYSTFSSTCLAFMCGHSYARMSACVGGWLCRMCAHVCASICPYNVKIPAAKDPCFRGGSRCWFEWQGGGHHWRQWRTWLWNGPCYCGSWSTCHTGLQRCSEGWSSSAENPLEARMYIHASFASWHRSYHILC